MGNPNISTQEDVKNQHGLPWCPRRQGAHLPTSHQLKHLLKHPTAKLPCSQAQNAWPSAYDPAELKGTALYPRRVFLSGKALLSFLSEPCRSAPNSRTVVWGALLGWGMMRIIWSRFRETWLSPCHLHNNMCNITYLHNMRYLTFILYMHTGIYSYKYIFTYK